VPWILPKSHDTDTTGGRTKVRSTFFFPVVRNFVLTWTVRGFVQSHAEIKPIEALNIKIEGRGEPTSRCCHMATFRMNAESMIRRRCVALAPRLRSRRALPGAALICFSLLLVLDPSAVRAATEEGDAKYSNVLAKASLSTRPAGEGTALKTLCPHRVHLAEKCSCPAEFLAESHAGLLNRW
jgi:hypothetical protein